MKRNALSLILAILACSAPRRQVTPADLWLWRFAADPQIAEDGSQVVYVENWSDFARNATYANLKLISVDGRQTRAFTNGEWNDRAPRWSPDGKLIAWIRASRAGDGTSVPDLAAGQPVAGQIFLATAADPEPAALTPPNLPVTAFAWSPDGKSIAFLSAGRLFLISAAGGAAWPLTAADLRWEGWPAWMPDGQNILAAGKAGEIFAIRAADGAPRQLTRSGEINRDPTPSPDGSKIAYTASRANKYYGVRRLWVMSADGSRARQLGGTLDRDVRHPQWSNDSRTVYFIADDHGATHVYLARNDGSVRQLTGRAERLWGFSLADNGRAVTVRSSAAEGSAVFTFMSDVPGGGWTLVDVDQPLLAERNWGAVEEMSFASAGKSIQAWLVKPFAFDPARKYPLLVEAADTPPRLYGAEFPLEAHIQAAGGLIVLMVNPRGTPGFGEEFGDLLPTEIAEAPADDLMKAVDAAVSKGYIDPKRIFAAGGASAAWLLGHTDRFAGIIAENPLADLTAWPAHSPIAFAENFKTPALILAGPQDPQADKLLAALQKQKVNATLLRTAPDPQARIQRLEAILKFAALAQM